MTQNLSEALAVKYGDSRNPDGRPSSWRHGETKTIRVPITLAEQVLEYARNLDIRDFQDMTQSLSGDLARESVQKQQAIALLEEGLTLKANAGGAIKDRIRAAIALLK